MSKKIFEGKPVFELWSAGPIGCDCTGPYNVFLLKEFTVEELIRAITEGVDEYERTEWGYIGIYDKGYYPFTDCRCEYRHGTVITNNIPSEMMQKKVISVKASGGWSRMDYCLTIQKEGTDDGN